MKFPFDILNSKISLAFRTNLSLFSNVPVKEAIPLLKHLAIPSKIQLAELSDDDLKLEIRRLQTSLHQYLRDKKSKEEVYRLSCGIDDLIVEYQKRTKDLHK